MTAALARRVAHRYAAIAIRDVPVDRIEYTDGGTISARDLERILRPSLGFLMKLRFRSSLRIDPNGVEWEAVNETGEIVSGKLVLHAAVSEAKVVSWAEVVVDAHC